MDAISLTIQEIVNDFEKLIRLDEELNAKLDFKKCDESGNSEEEHLRLDGCSDSIYFSDFVRLAKATEEKLTSFFDEEKEALAQRFTPEEINSLKVGILGRALGVKEYL